LRIENGFQEFVHRADDGDVTESFDVICGHANVHRYFVFRALQSVYNLNENHGLEPPPSNNFLVFY